MMNLCFSQQFQEKIKKLETKLRKSQISKIIQLGRSFVLGQLIQGEKSTNKYCYPLSRGNLAGLVSNLP